MTIPWLDTLRAEAHQGKKDKLPAVIDPDRLLALIELAEAVSNLNGPMDWANGVERALIKMKEVS